MTPVEIIRVGPRDWQLQIAGKAVCNFDYPSDAYSSLITRCGASNEFVRNLKREPGRWTCEVVK